MGPKQDSPSGGAQSLKAECTIKGGAWREELPVCIWEKAVLKGPQRRDPAGEGSQGYGITEVRGCRDREAELRIRDDPDRLHGSPEGHVHTVL